VAVGRKVCDGDIGAAITGITAPAQKVLLSAAVFGGMDFIRAGWVHIDGQQCDERTFVAEF
jgi:hypothetical protein